MSLQFEIAELRQEIHAFVGIAGRKLDRTAPALLRQLESDLDNIAVRTTSGRWSLESPRPLRTQLSAGSYQPGDRGEECLFGELTFIWELQPIRPRGEVGRRARIVELSGKASTKVRLMMGDPDNPNDATDFAMWRFEAGDVAHPGCHFHVQVLGEAAEPPFPKTVDIPRLPSILLSPVACFEFALGELFQDEWKRIGSAQSKHMMAWRKIQLNRYRRQLEWHQGVLTRSPGSPWVAWKIAKPPPALFLDR